MIPVFLANIYFTFYSLLCCELSVLHRLWHTLSLLCSDLKQISEGELLTKKIKQHFTMWDLNSPVLLGGWIIAQYSGLPVMGPACLSRARDCGAPTSDPSLGNPALSVRCWLEIVGLLSQLEQSPAPTLPCRIQLGNQSSCCLFGCHSIYPPLCGCTQVVSFRGFGGEKSSQWKAETPCRCLEILCVSVKSSVSSGWVLKPEAHVLLHFYWLQGKKISQFQ